MLAEAAGQEGAPSAEDVIDTHGEPSMAPPHFRQQVVLHAACPLIAGGLLNRETPYSIAHRRCRPHLLVSSKISL